MKKLKNMVVSKSKVWIVDLILIVLTLVVIVGLVNYGISDDRVLLSPDDFDQRTGELFRFSGVSGIVVSDGLNFEGGERYIVFDGQVIAMNRGLSYMRLDYGGYYEVRSFDLDQNLEMVLRKNGDGSYSVLVNEGDFVVSVFDGDGDLRNNILWEGTK
jgi:hypothetical protein